MTWLEMEQHGLRLHRKCLIDRSVWRNGSEYVIDEVTDLMSCYDSDSMEFTYTAKITIESFEEASNYWGE